MDLGGDEQSKRDNCRSEKDFFGSYLELDMSACLCPVTEKVTWYLTAGTRQPRRLSGHDIWAAQDIIVLPRNTLPFLIGSKLVAHSTVLQWEIMK